MSKEAPIGKLSILDCFRFAASICIIVLHAFLEETDFFNVYGSEILGRWPVGLFFMISGFFLGRTLKDVTLYCVRILEIYIPWTIFYALWLHIDIWSPRDFLSALRTGIIMPFWYFSSLIMCVVFVSVLRCVVNDPIKLCVITGCLYIIAIMGSTLSNIQGIPEILDRYFFVWHERLVGVHQTRNGIFNGSFLLSIGIALKHRYDEDKLKISNVTLFYSLLGLTIVCHIAEIVCLIYFNIGDRDVLVTAPVLSAMIIILSFQYEMPKSLAVMLRKMSIVVFVIHCFYLDVFQRIGLSQWTVFGLTLVCSVLSGLIYAAATRFLLYNINKSN